MPKVPTYQPGQVQEAGLPTVRNQVEYSREAFGGGASSEKMFGAAQGLAETYKKIKDRTNDALLKEGDVVFSKLETDTAAKIKMMRGKDAAGFNDIIDKDWDKGVEDILNKYEDNDVKAGLKRLAETRRASLYKTGSGHMVGELDKFEQATHEAFIDSHRSEAVFNYRDPNKIKDSVAIQKDAILRHASQRGWSDDETVAELEKAESQTHLQVLTRMVNNGEDMVASKYYSDIKKSLRGDDASAADKLLREGTLRGESQRKSDAIVSKSQNMTEALDTAREIKDPSLRDETVTRVKQYYSEKKQADDQRVEDLHRRAGNTIDQSGSVDTIPREDWTQFSVSEKKALQDYAEKGGSTDFDVYYNLRLMASGTPAQQEKFKKINLADVKLLPKLSNKDRETMVDLQTQMRSGKSSADKQLDDWRTEESIISSNLKAAGINPNPKQGSDEASRVNQFRSMVGEKVRQHQRQTGKTATNDDYERIVNSLLVNLVTDSSFFGLWKTKKPAFEVEPGTPVSLEYDDIPMAERRHIEGLMRQAGEPVTKDAVIEYWKSRSGIFNGK